VDGGDGRACRGASAKDNSDMYYAPLSEYVYADTDLSAGAGTSTADRCRQLCRNVPGCAGVELKEDGSKHSCEVWTRSGGIQASIPASNYSCWHYEPVKGATPAVASDPRFSGVDGGFMRVCRDKDGAHAEKDYKATSAASLLDCQKKCLKDPECKGIEFDDVFSTPQRCELWTTAVGSTVYRPGYWCMARNLS